MCLSLEMKQKMKILYFLLLLLSCEAYDLGEMEIDLRKKHGIENSTHITQDTLQRIIAGAERGDRDNLYFLGLLKLYGITIKKDVSGAAIAFEKAALLGNPDAQTAIGVMKMKGIGVPEDFPGAVDMFRKATEQGNGNGQWLLARMLIEGKGVRNDNPQQNYLEGFLYASKAADVHHIPQAEHLVGLIYEYGIGIQQDFTKALNYYRRAAEQRYIESMYNLALMYVYGRGTDIQFPRGLSLFETGCMANHAPSCHYMGIMKTYGYGTPVDYHEAVLWFEKSSSLDDERISKESANYAEILSKLIHEAEEQNNKVVDEYMRRQEQYEDL